MDNKKIVIGAGLIGAALYLMSSGETYQTGVGSLGSGFSGGGESGVGLGDEIAEIADTPEKLSDTFKSIFNIPDDITTDKSFTKDSNVYQNISDVGMSYDYMMQSGKKSALAQAKESGDYSNIFGYNKKSKPTGKAFISTPYSNVSDVGMSADYMMQSGKKSALAQAKESGDYSNIFGSNSITTTDKKRNKHKLKITKTKKRRRI